MKTGFSPKHVLIIRPLPPALANAGSLETLINAAKKHLYSTDIPIHWNLHAQYLEGHTPDKNDDINNILKDPSGYGDVRILPAGYSDRPHHLMTGEEISRDIERGVDALYSWLDEPAGRIFSLPYYPDTEKSDSKEIYSRENLLLLAPGNGPDENYSLRSSEGFFIPAEIIRGSIKRKRNRFVFNRRERVKALIMEFPTLRSIASADHRMEDLLNLYGKRKFISMEEAFSSKDLLTEGVNTEAPPFCSPGWREYIRNGSEPGKPVAPPSQDLIADMLGTVAMEDDNFTVHFDQGRWKGISRKGEVFIPKRKAGCFFHLNGKKMDFLPPAAYSFDSSYSRGLREIQRFVIDSREKGKIVTDYFFTDDYPCIVISVTVQFPIFRDPDIINSFGILEISLFEGSENELPLIVEYNRPSSDVLSSNSFTEEGDYHISGSSFRFRLKEKVFSLTLPEEGPEIITIPIRIRKKEGRYMIMINPWGSYLPLEGNELTGLTEHFTLLLEAGLDEEISGKKPPLDRYPDKTPFRIGRKESLR